MLHDRVGRRHQPQRVAPMANLSARLLAGALAQALGLARQPVTGRRLAAVVAILGQPRFQLLHMGHQRGDLLPLTGIFGFELGDACFWRHAPMLRLQCKSA